MSGGFFSPHHLDRLFKMQAVTLDKGPAVVCRVGEALDFLNWKILSLGLKKNNGLKK